MTDDLNIRVTLQNMAKRGLSGLKNDLGKVNKGAADAAKSMKGFYVQMAGIAGLLASGALFGSAVKTFADFDDNMRGVAAVTGATTDEMVKMTNVAKEMGKETRYTASNAAEALRFLGMAGFEASEATTALPGVLNLAAAGALDLGSAADIATNVLSAFGLEVENLSQVNDVLVKTFTSSNVNLVEIGEAFKIVGPIAKGVGSDFEDLVGAIGALGTAGIKGTLAGTALKGTIGALLNPTAQESKLLAGLTDRLGGVALQIKDSDGDFVGFQKTLEQLEQAGIRGDEALAIFGERAGPGMAALLNMGSDSLADLIEKLRNAGGVSEEIAEKMEAGIGGQLRKTVSVIESVKIALGEAFGPEVQVILTAFRDWLVSVTNTLIKLQKDGNLSGWGRTVVDVFTGINWVVSKTVNLFQSWIALSIVAGAALTGNFALAQEALKGYLEESKSLVGIGDKFDGSVTKPITAEMNKARKVLENAGKPSGPLGKGSKKLGKGIANNIVPVSIEAKLKAALIRLNAMLGQEEAQLEADYEQKKVSLDKYYTDRLEIITRRSAQEREILVNKFETETDISKKEILNAQLFSLDKKLQIETIALDAEKIKAQDDLKEKELSAQLKVNRLKVKAEKALQDQKDRLRSDETTTLDSLFQKEISDLQTRQNAELETVRVFHKANIDALNDRKASELEIETAFAEQKKAISDQTAAQAQEKEQMAADQQMRLNEYKINNLKNIAGGAAQIFGQLYEMMGKENKELFYLAKAAAIAEATINTATAITKALPNIPMAVIAGAMGAAQIAVIAGQGLAAGGEVRGNSPTSTSDDILIRATSREFMQPVSAVDYYGLPFMEAIRHKTLLKGAFAGYAAGGPITNRSRNINNVITNNQKNNSPNQGTESPQVNIINVTDPSQIESYLASSAGQNAVLNILGARPEAAQRMLRSGV